MMLLKRKGGATPREYCKKPKKKEETSKPTHGKPPSRRMTKMERDQQARKAQQDDFLLFLKKEKEKEKEKEEEKDGQDEEKIRAF